MLHRYRFFTQKAFESHTKFEVRLNEEVRKGWRAIGITGSGGGTLVVMLERES